MKVIAYENGKFTLEDSSEIPCDLPPWIAEMAVGMDTETMILKPRIVETDKGPVINSFSDATPEQVAKMQQAKVNVQVGGKQKKNIG